VKLRTQERRDSYIDLFVETCISFQVVSI